MTLATEISLLFATGLAAGFVDSIAGGGGLLTVPALLSICPNPVVALGTNKLQATFGSTSATFHYARAGALNLPDCWRACLLAFLGSLTGAALVQMLNVQLLKQGWPCSRGGRQSSGKPICTRASPAGNLISPLRSALDCMTAFSGPAPAPFWRWLSCWVWVST